MNKFSQRFNGKLDVKNQNWLDYVDPQKRYRCLHNGERVMRGQSQSNSAGEQVSKIETTSNKVSLVRSVN